MCKDRPLVSRQKKKPEQRQLAGQERANSACIQNCGLPKPGVPSQYRSSCSMPTSAFNASLIGYVQTP